MRRVRLGDTARFINGAAFKPSDWAEDGLPIIRIQNLTGTGEAFNRTNRKVKPDLVVDPGDLLVSWSATLDAYRWAGPQGVLNQHIFKVLPNEGVRPDYLYYALREVISELERKTHGSTMKHVVRGDFESTTIPLPSVEEQDRIVDLLSRAESIVRMRREADKKAKEIIPALFLDMFGDPATNPKGWAVRRLDEVADVRDGTHETPKYVPDGIPFITSKHLCGISIDFDSAEYISAEDHADYSRRSAVDDGDILFGMIGTIGKATWVRKDREFSIKNVALVKPRSAQTAYLWAFLGLETTLSGLLGSRAKGGNQRFVSLGILRSERVPDPPKALQDRFAYRVTEALTLITLQSRAVERADSAFQSLLAEMFRA